MIKKILEKITISEIICDIYKDIHCLCYKCNSEMYINFITYSEIEIDHLCYNSNIINIKDLELPEVKNKKILSKFTCKKHKNLKYNSFCITCKKESCPECHCKNVNHILVKLDCGNMINFIDEEIKKRFLGKINIEINITEIEDIIEKKESEEDFHFYKLISIIINDYKNYPTYEQYQTISNIYDFLKDTNKNKIYKDKAAFLMKYKCDENNIQLFGEEFINNNKDNCYIIINGEKVS